MCAREFVFEYVSTHACVCGHVYACVHMCACTSACVRGEGKEWKVEKEEKEMKEEGSGAVSSLPHSSHSFPLLELYEWRS